MKTFFAALLATLSMVAAQANDRPLPPPSCEVESTCLVSLGACTPSEVYWSDRFMQSNEERAFAVAAKADVVSVLQVNKVCVTAEGNVARYSVTQRRSESVHGSDVKLEYSRSVDAESVYSLEPEILQEAQKRAVDACRAWRANYESKMLQLYPTCPKP